MHSSNLANALLKEDTIKKMGNVAQKLAGTFKNIAPMLGPGLGIASVLLGSVPALASPSPQDILRKVNEGFQKLTNDVNNRLEKMKEYVDYKVLKQEKRLMTNDYKELYRFWTNCVNEHTKEKVNRCQRYAAKHMHAKQPTFTAFQSQYENQQSLTSGNDVKRLEISLIVSKQYVTLRLLWQQIMVKNECY